MYGVWISTLDLRRFRVSGSAGHRLRVSAVLHSGNPRCRVSGSSGLAVPGDVGCLDLPGSPGLLRLDLRWWVSTWTCRAGSFFGYLMLGAAWVCCAGKVWWWLRVAVAIGGKSLFGLDLAGFAQLGGGCGLRSAILAGG